MINQSLDNLVKKLRHFCQRLSEHPVLSAENFIFVPVNFDFCVRLDLKLPKLVLLRL